MTDHIEAPPRFLPWRWVLLHPALWLLDRLIDLPTCLLCLKRDDPGE